MMYRFWWIAGLASIVLASIPWTRAHGAHSSGPAAEVLPPNVLVVVIDDLGLDFLNAYGIGSDLPKTPTIDGLALDGVRFYNAWAAPLCSPTRAMLQTGRHGFATGIGHLVAGTGLGLPLDELTLPEMLDQGTGHLYAHACFGKWHLGNNSVGGLAAPNWAGYSHFAGTMNNFVGADTFQDWVKVVNGVSQPFSGYATTVVVDDAIAWIGAQSQPWLTVLNFHAPHWPWHIPPAHLHSVNFTGMPPPNIYARPYAKAMMEALDAELGRLLAALGPELENTLVIVLGDNGTDNLVVAPPIPTWKAKGSIFEGGLRVPLIVSGPGVSQGISMALVSVVDVFPTVAAAAGVDLPSLVGGKPLHGLSLWPHLENPAAPSSRSMLYSELFWPNGVGTHQSYDGAMRDARFKFVKSGIFGELLFDLQNDPYETVNLLSHPPLSPEAKRAYRKLKLGMAHLLGS